MASSTAGGNAMGLPFDQRDGIIWYDGKVVPWADAKLHVLSHGLHYASSVFEGERAYGGEIFKCTEHSERLKRSAELLDFDIPYSVAEIDAAKSLVLEKNSQSDAYVRPVAWRGSEMMGVSAQRNKIHLAVATWEWPSYFDPVQRLKGIRLDLADYRRPDPKTAPCLAKAAGLYMICTISKHRAERKGYADAMMLDWQGRGAECTGANIFFIKDGKIHTPIADCFLAGITRATAIDLATRQMVEKIREVYERYGFEPVETPAMEFTDALGKFLPDQDRPNEGVFSFQDDDGQWLSLRYDLTAPLARYVAENFDALPKPFRRYAWGSVWRNEKPGPGRFRQFMQFDADTVGTDSVAADAEMCMMAADAMEALGIPRGSYVVKINSRKVLDGILETIGAITEEQRLVV